MEKDGGGSTCPKVGPRRGEDKCNYLGPQAEETNDADH
jgi:hypothetical protein